MKHLLFAALLSIFSGLTIANDDLAPKALSNHTMILTIDAGISDLKRRAPDRGIAVHQYITDVAVTVFGKGGKHHPEGEGSYQYSKTALDAGQEQGELANTGQYQIDYQFLTSHSGTFEQSFSDNQSIIRGTFQLESAQADIIAPDSLVGQVLALSLTSTTSKLDGGYPQHAIFLQQYQEATLTGTGYGQYSVDFEGKYQFERTSATTAVEVTEQTMNRAVYDYTMAFTFETPTTGTWLQNFGDGMIIFRGNFSLYQSR